MTTIVSLATARNRRAWVIKILPLIAEEVKRLANDPAASAQEKTALTALLRMVKRAELFAADGAYEKAFETLVPCMRAAYRVEQEARHG